MKTERGMGMRQGGSASPEPLLNFWEVALVPFLIF